MKVRAFLSLSSFCLFSFFLFGFLVVSCSDSRSPTSPGRVMLSGTVVSGSSPGSPGGAMGSPVPNVTVRAGNTGPSTQTDMAGNFTLMSVPAGNVLLELSRSDIHASVSVNASAGSSVFIAVTATSARVISGEEIEGIVQSVDAGGNSLTVQDQRLGMVMVKVDSSTVIRKGQMPVALADIQMGWRVHVKALKQGDGTNLATEIIVQNMGAQQTPTPSPGPSPTSTPSVPQ